MTPGLSIAVVGCSTKQIKKAINDVFEREGPLRSLEVTRYLAIDRIEQVKRLIVDQVIILADKYGNVTPAQYDIVDILKYNLRCTVPEEFRLQKLLY